MGNRWQRIGWLAIALLGIYILHRGIQIGKESGILQRIPGIGKLEESLEAAAAGIHMPGLLFSYDGEEEKDFLELVWDEILPLYSYAREAASRIPDMESKLEYELMVEADIIESGQAEAVEEEAPYSERETFDLEKDTSYTEEMEEKETDTEENQLGLTARDPDRDPLVTYDLEQLRDDSYLLNQFFSVDPSTTPLESLINYELLMGKDLSIEEESDDYQILIYHTHSQEAFADSREGEVEDTIVGAGMRLADLLTELYGFSVLHHREVYDLVDGVLDRNLAYTLAAPAIQQILEEHPSIQVVIDLHRDGVDGHKFVQTIEGKQVAQIMFFNGLSYRADSGAITYLANPYLEENLAFSFQLQMKAAQYYPGWTRNIYLNSLRYNLHLKERALLIEAGTQLNTVEEEYNAMELLADILNQVLRGK